MEVGYSGRCVIYLCAETLTADPQYTASLISSDTNNLDSSDYQTN